MKPTFALDLTRETISLLHRTPKGWLPVGEVAFDAPDLAEALDYMRKTALGLSPLGVATKLILPNGQILYTEIHAPGPSRDEKRQQIAAALEGRTPYAVEDLVFDWSGKGATVKVAVIAKETLAEAESFAVEHRLNPVSFVAIPEEGKFVGEPWFGPSAAAASILAEDETVERDRDAVSILHRELPKVETAATPAPPPEPATEPEAEAAPALAPEVAPAPDTAADSAVPETTPAVAEASEDDLPGLQAALDSEPTAEPTEMPAAAPPAPETEPVAVTPEDLADDDPEAILAREALASATVGNAAAPLADTGAPALARTAPAKAEPAPDPDEAPFAHVTDTAAFPDSEGESRGLGTAAARNLSDVDLDDDLPPAPPSAAMVAFASRRAAAADTSARPVEGVTRGAGGATGAMKAPAAARATAAKGFPGLVTAPSIPGTRAKPKLKGGDIPRPAIGGPTTAKSPARPGGTFGSVAPAKKRTGTVFLVMVGLLLLFLVLVGAWASYYLGGRNGATVDQSAATMDVVPDIDDEMLADMQDPEGMTAPIPEADPVLPETADSSAPATEDLPLDAGGEELAVDADLAAAEPDVAAIEALPEDGADVAADIVPEAAPEPAPDTLVVTDVSAATAPVEQQDEIFLSAMDAAPPALDALALPPLAESRDLLPDPVMPPPAPGTVYQFDANGLLKPTPDGILSPDGVFLIAGKPPRLPPARSEAATAAALAAAPVPATEQEGAADDATAPADASQAASPSDASLVTAGTDAAAEPEAELPLADPAMAGFRPRPRPEGLVPETPDDAALTPETTTDFAGLRPLARPASVTAAAAALAPAPATDLGAQGASLTAQAEARLAEAAALEARNPSIVAISMRPAARPNDFRGAVEAAVAAAVREPIPAPAPPEAAPVKAAAAAKPEELDDLDEPEIVATAAPSIPTKASVAKQATYSNAINLSKINLIGTYGTDSRRYALIRQSNGKYKKVQVGDKIDGGTVKAITETEVRYQKGGRLLSLKMPKA